MTKVSETRSALRRMALTKCAFWPFSAAKPKPVDRRAEIAAIIREGLFGSPDAELSDSELLKRPYADLGFDEYDGSNIAYWAVRNSPRKDLQQGDPSWVDSIRSGEELHNYIYGRGKARRAALSAAVKATRR